MFPQPESRIRTALRRSVDAAIDFATLGEYGLASAWEDPAAAGSGTAARARHDSAATAPAGLALRAGVPAGVLGTGAPDARPGSRTPTALQPASAAGRARRDAAKREAPRCAGQPLRGRAMEAQLPRVARSREGMAPHEQRCVLHDA